jgi:hypothetical protein
MSAKTLRQSSPGHRYSTRRLVNKLNPSDTLSKDLIARAFLKAPKLTFPTSLSCVDNDRTDTLLVSQSSFQTAPTSYLRGDQHRLFSDSFTSISVDNGLGSPTRRPTSSPRRSPRRALSSSSPSQRINKRQYPKSKQRLCDSCPDFEYVIPKPPSEEASTLIAVNSGDANDHVKEDGPLPEKDATLGKESMRHIESHKKFFQERRPNRRKVQFASVRETTPPIVASHILHLSVFDLQLPTFIDHELSRTKQYELIRDLEREIRASTRQVERFDEMIEYEGGIVQELERENLVLRRRILEFPTSLPSRKELKLQIQEVEANMKQSMKCVPNKPHSSGEAKIVTAGRRVNKV